jgi:ABC-type branched-subunit amino acid transport system ATPase component/ABC-type branched-subunit amino acid transport system permease subunit
MAAARICWTAVICCGLSSCPAQLPTRDLDVLSTVMQSRPTKRHIRTVTVVIVTIAAAKIVTGILDAAHVIRMSTPLPTLLLGVIIGLTYGLLAAGLVLIFRTNRIINFAHGQIGAFGAAFCGLAAVKWHVPYWIAFVLALVLSAGTGAVAETAVVRRLRNAPRLMSIVATLGVGQFLVLFAVVINSQATAGAVFPQPPGLPVFRFGGLLVTQAYSGMLLLSPLLVIGLTAFLARSKHGLAMRAAAANPEAARMAGVFAGRMSTVAWAIAGALSAFVAILTAPTQGFAASDSFGPGLLLRAMTGAVIARMSSLPVALLAGVGLGVIEQVLTWNYPHAGLVEVSLFAIILLALLLQRQRGGRDEDKGSWAAVEALRPLPDRLREIWLVRNLGVVAGLVAIVLAAVIPMSLSNSTAVTLTSIVGFSIVGLSVGVLSGLGGQLTLGQFALGAIGAVISFRVSAHSDQFALGLLYAGLGAGVVSVLIGLPALRIRGVMLTVTTLSFALATPAWLLSQSWAVGSGQDPGKPIVFGRALETGRSYYLFALGLFVVCLVLARNVRRSGFGRLLVAIRDNEDNARAFTVPAAVVKVQAYFVAGFIAGIGGATYGHGLSRLTVDTFPASHSVTVVVMTVLGGVSFLGGPVLGAAYVLGLPLLPLDSAGLAATNLGALALILWKPAGIVALLTPIRDGLVRVIARRHHLDARQIIAAADSGDDEATDTTITKPVAAMTLVRSAPAIRGRGLVLLEARELRRHFGGVKAVDGVSFTVGAGETVGLIGPNGAGKTTTFELLGGFTKPDHGQVIFDHQEVTRLGPEARARLGLIRSFQDAALFPTMTVTECVELSLERTDPTHLLSSVAGLPAGGRRKRARARELVSFMGLDRYRDKPVLQLSTGTRRITELACLMALEPLVLLLDEPSSGVAQRETEALGTLLQELKSQLNLTLVIIEHDIPLVMGLSDRIIAMADGHILSQGSPDEVRNDRAVVEAYLGGSLTAIERSGRTRRRSTEAFAASGEGR